VLCVEIALYNTDFALPMTVGDFALFLHDFSKNGYSFFLSRTVHLETEPSCLLNLPVCCVIHVYDLLKFTHFEAYH